MLLSLHGDCSLLAPRSHMHGYERTEAVLGSKVVALAANGTTYTAPGAPVYIVNGAGGNREGNDNPKGDAPWSAPGAHFGDIGFGLLSVTTTQMTYTFVNSTSGDVLDTAVWLK